MESKRRWGLWILAAVALFAAGCVLTTDFALEHLPEPMAAWIRTETVLWRGCSWSEWIDREAATWRWIFGG